MEWISVDNLLPQDGIDVLVYHLEDDHITVGYFVFFGFALAAFFELFARDPPGNPILTLVAPLPAPPVTVILPCV